MVMNRTNALCFVLLSMLVVGCGGGGGGGGDTAFFGGVWNGVLSVVEDPCALVAEDYVFFNHLVNQDGSQIVIDNGVVTFSGSVQSDTSFSASAERAFRALTPGSACTEKITWRYEAIDEQAGIAQFVARVSEVTCSDGTSCRFGFSGSAVRMTTNPGGPIVYEPVSAEGQINEASL
jgi:hypothetical protein